MVIKNITYSLAVTTTDCFSCKESFELYDIQKTSMNFCNVCNPNNKLTKLTTLFLIIESIVKFAEQQNKKVDDRLILDVAELVDKLQERQ